MSNTSESNYNTYMRIDFHNNMQHMVECMYNSHVSLIKNICYELGVAERSSEMIERFIDDSVRIKKYKDKKHPKRPKSGYMIFGDENRERIRKSMPEDTKFKDVVRKIASEWNNLSHEEKKPYQIRAEADKERYIQDVEKYKSEVHSSNLSSSN